jgi:hypothetical protein
MDRGRYHDFETSVSALTSIVLILRKYGLLFQRLEPAIGTLRDRNKLYSSTLKQLFEGVKTAFQGGEKAFLMPSDSYSIPTLIDSNSMLRDSYSMLELHIYALRDSYSKAW